MGRRPIGETAMTATEASRRFRAKDKAIRWALLDEVQAARVLRDKLTTIENGGAQNAKLHNAFKKAVKAYDLARAAASELMGSGK